MDDVVHELRLLINEGNGITIDSEEDSRNWQNSTMHTFNIVEGILNDLQVRGLIDRYRNDHHNYSVTPDDMIMGSFEAIVSKFGFESRMPFRGFFPVNMSITSW